MAFCLVTQNRGTQGRREHINGLILLFNCYSSVSFYLVIPLGLLNEFFFVVVLSRTKYTESPSFLVTYPIENFKLIIWS